MNNKLFISFFSFFISSLIYSVDYNKELLNAASSGNIKQVTEAINNGANIEAKNKLRLTALFESIIGGHTDIVNLLLTKGANVNTKDNQNYGILHHILSQTVTPNLEAVKALFFNSKLIITPQDLDFAVEQALKSKVSTGSGFSNLYPGIKEIYQKQNKGLNQIGQMMINYLKTQPGNQGIDANKIAKAEAIFKKD